MAIIFPADLATWIQLPDVNAAGVAAAVNAANQRVESYCDRIFSTTAIADASSRTFFPSSGGYCDVDDFWETTALVVELDFGDDGTYETTWTLNTDFYLEPLNGLINGRSRPYNRIVPTNGRVFPYCSTRPSVQVTAAWGWAAIPAEVTQAALMIAARLFRRKDSVEGVLGGFDDFGIRRVSRYEDPDVQMLLRDYVNPRTAIGIAG